MLKYDWLKIAEMHVFAKSVAVAAFVMADTPHSKKSRVIWTLKNEYILAYSSWKKIAILCNFTS